VNCMSIELSIVIPCYNEEETIRVCVEKCFSVIKQNSALPPFQWVIDYFAD
jgi:glycosyltransferase involved in cell wall biosynthesis